MNRWPWLVLLGALLALAFAALRMTVIPVAAGHLHAPTLRCPSPLRDLFSSSRPRDCDHPITVALAESVIAALVGLGALVVVVVAAFTRDRRVESAGGPDRATP